MAKITMEEAKDFALLPKDSIVNLKITEAVIKEVQGQRGPWEKLEITFEILGIQATGDGSDPAQYQSVIGSKIWGSIPFRLNDSAENKLRIWSEAILGMELGIGFELDTDYFVGRQVRGLTGQYDKRNRDAQGNPFKGHQIDSLLPAATQPTVNTAAAPTTGGYAYGGTPAVNAAPAQAQQQWEPQPPPF